MAAKRTKYGIRFHVKAYDAPINQPTIRPPRLIIVRRQFSHLSVEELRARVIDELLAANVMTIALIPEWKKRE